MTPSTIPGSNPQGKRHPQAGLLPTASWLAVGGVVTAMLVIVLAAGSAAGWGNPEKIVTPKSTDTLSAPTAPAPTPTPPPATATATPTRLPLTATPSPTLLATPSSTATPSPTPSNTPQSTLALPTETPAATSTPTLTPVPCPGNQVWNGAECACPPGTVWIAQNQWCIVPD